MNGIENIISKIMSDAQAEADKILNEAELTIKGIKEDTSAKISSTSVAAKRNAEQRVADVFAKSLQASSLDRRKLLATERQAIISETFGGALTHLLNLSTEDYYDLLLSLVQRVIGDSEGGEILLNESDHRNFGERLIKEINGKELVDKIKEAKNLVASTVEKVLGGKIPSLSTLINDNAEKFTGKLVILAEDTVDIVGGVIVRRGKIEYNCSVDAIVKNLSQESASMVFGALFSEGE